MKMKALGRTDVNTGAEAKPARRYETIEVAAAKLSLDPDALRARCRRAARVEDGSIVADLGMGIRAFKFGRSWRVLFPSP